MQSQTQDVSTYLSINAKAYSSKLIVTIHPAVTNPDRVQLSLDKCEGFLLKAHGHNHAVTNPGHYLSINAKAYSSKPSHNPTDTNPGRVQLSLDKCEGVVPTTRLALHSPQS